MSSAARAVANKQNSKNSTGPNTPEGKRTSSLNAVRHGLTSQLVVLPTEDQAAYETFRASLFEDLKPQGTVETMLAQTVCDTEWRLERARRTETNILALVHHEELPSHITAIENPEERQAMTEAYGWNKYERTLRNLQLHESRLQRTLSKTLDEFHALQDRRKQEADDLMNEATNTKIHHIYNKLPFDPAALGFVFTNEQIDAELKRRHIAQQPHKPFSFEPKRPDPINMF